jgi:hypothetical protein
VRKHRVEKDQVRSRLFHCLDESSDIGRDVNGDALALEHRGDARREVRIVVDDQDAHSLRSAEGEHLIDGGSERVRIDGLRQEQTCTGAGSRHAVLDVTLLRQKGERQALQAGQRAQVMGEIRGVEPEGGIDECRVDGRPALRTRQPLGRHGGTDQPQQIFPP